MEGLILNDLGKSLIVGFETIFVGVVFSDSGCLILADQGKMKVTNLRGGS